MIEEQIRQIIRNGVCAIGFLPFPQSDYNKVNMATDFMEIIGTGFIVRENLIVTNRHVVRNLRDIANKKGIPISQFVLQFIYPREEQKRPQLCFCQIIGILDAGNPEIDATFIEFNQDVFKNNSFEPCKPLSIIDNISTVKIGQTVGVMGYAGGTDLLTDGDGRIHRLGPVLHTGIISAISPYEEQVPNGFLLDIRSAGGMSGSPVFDIDYGNVLGILTKGRDKFLEVAIPINKSGLKHWLRIIDDYKNERGNNFICGNVKRGVGVASKRLAVCMPLLSKYLKPKTEFYPGTLNIELDSNFPTPQKDIIFISQSELDSIEKGFNESWTLIPVKGINDTNIKGFILRTSTNYHGDKTVELISSDLSNINQVNISAGSRIILFV